MPEKYWYLKNCELFEQLAPEQVESIEAHSRLRKFSRGEPIYLPADDADGVLLLASGRVRICGFTPEGKQSILSFIEPGEVFGELSVLESGPRDEFAEAVKASTVLLISASEMRRVIDEVPTVALRVTKLMGLRRKRVERRLKYLLFHSNRDRLVHLLLELAGQYGIVVTEGVDLGINLAHQDLAGMIGSTRETVTIVLGELQKAGLIKVGRQKILLKEIQKLAESVHLEPPQIASRPRNEVFPMRQEKELRSFS